jgi:type IV pilus assembly protein PilC
MPEWTLKYADARGEMHQQVAQAESEGELRDRLTEQGFLVYSIQPRSTVLGGGLGKSRKKLNLERFLIFNQQFVTLVRAGLPILKSLDLLADRLTDPKLSKYIQGVRQEVKNGALLSEAFARQGVFPPIYVTSVLAGERSGALADVLDRYIGYQKLSLSVRRKLIASLLYPAMLVFMALGLIVFLVTYVVPNFARLYSDLGAELPLATQFLIALGTTARGYVVGGFVGLVAALIAFRFWMRTPSGQMVVDRLLLRVPLAGEVWLKYQVAQFSRMLGTLLMGGIPLMQALNTASESLGTPVLKGVLTQATKLVREGQSLSGSLRLSNIFPSLSLDMMEVGESTGALPAMLSSVAEFYEEDVSSRVTALLSLIEPIIMVIMAVFVGFILVSLYLPIFSLADSIRS